MYASSRPAFTDFMLNTAKLVHFLETTKRFPKYFICVLKHEFYPPPFANINKYSYLCTLSLI